MEFSSSVTEFAEITIESESKMPSEIHPIISQTLKKYNNPKLRQYFAIHAMRRGLKYDKGEQTDLAEAVHENFKTITQDAKREIVVPTDFIFFKGYDGGADVVSDILWPYVIPFGSESK